MWTINFFRNIIFIAIRSWNKFSLLATALPYALLPNNFIVSAINSYALSMSPALLASDTSSANCWNLFSGVYLIAQWNLVIFNPCWRYHFNNGVYNKISSPKYEPINFLPLLMGYYFHYGNFAYIHQYLEI